MSVATSAGGSICRPECAAAPSRVSPVGFPVNCVRRLIATAPSPPCGDAPAPSAGDRLRVRRGRMGRDDSALVRSRPSVRDATRRCPVAVPVDLRLGRHRRGVERRHRPRPARLRLPGLRVGVGPDRALDTYRFCRRDSRRGMRRAGTGSIEGGRHTASNGHLCEDSPSRCDPGGRLTRMLSSTPSTAGSTRILEFRSRVRS